MRIESAAVPLVPRTASECLDLAVMYVGRRLGSFLALWLAIALPTCVLIHQVCTWYDVTVLGAAAILFFATSPLGVLFMLLVIPGAFGEPLPLAQLWKRYGRRMVLLVGKGLILRVGIAVWLLLFIVPGLWLAVRKGFIVEQFCLTADRKQLHDEQTEQMLRREGMNLFGRGMAITLCCGLLAFVMFLLVDFTLDAVLGYPVFIGRLEEVATGFFRFDPGLSLYSLMVFTVTDPMLLAVASAAVLFAYPIGRLAWFFCYVDVRVRRDLWDVELQFRRLEQRLEVEA